LLFLYIYIYVLGFSLFFNKKQDFVLFLTKTDKPHSELFLLHHAISLFSVLHNNNLLYLLWHSKLRVKKCTPSLFSQSIVGQFTPKWYIRLGKHAHSKQRQTTPTHTQLFHVKFMCIPASSASTECIFSICDLVWSKIRKSLDAEKAEKLVKIY